WFKRIWLIRIFRIGPTGGGWRHPPWIRAGRSSPDAVDGDVPGRRRVVGNRPERLPSVLDREPGPCCHGVELGWGGVPDRPRSEPYPAALGELDELSVRPLRGRVVAADREHDTAGGEGPDLDVIAVAGWIVGDERLDHEAPTGHEPRGHRHAAGLLSRGGAVGATGGRERAGGEGRELAGTGVAGWIVGDERRDHEPPTGQEPLGHRHEAGLLALGREQVEDRVVGDEGERERSVRQVV